MLIFYNIYDLCIAKSLISHTHTHTDYQKQYNHPTQLLQFFDDLISVSVSFMIFSYWALFYLWLLALPF